MLRKTINDNFDFVKAYGALVKLVGRAEVDNIMLVLSHSDASPEEKMAYLKDLVWCIKYQQVAVTTNSHLN